MEERSYEELMELKTEVDDAIEELKRTTKTTTVSIAMRAVFAGCTSVIISKLTDAFLPKSLKAPVKLAVAAGTFMIPELAANIGGSITEKIMEEE